jgi:hypothetical protein
VVLVHEHRLNEVRVLEEKGRPARERKRRDIARQPGELLEKREGLTVDAAPKAPNRAIELRRVR